MRGQQPSGVPAGGAFGSGRQVEGTGPAKVNRQATTTAPNVAAGALPSAKLKPTLASPFAKPADAKTPFAAQYAAGGIPCRINHGGVKHTLLWSRPVEDIPYDPYLLLFAEGLRETVHPHTFVARTAFAELLLLPDAYDRLAPLLARLMQPLRAALSASDASCVAAGLAAVRQLATAAGEQLPPHVAPLLVMINRHDSNRLLRDDVRATLEHIDAYGGPQAGAVIRAKLPAWGRG